MSALTEQSALGALMLSPDMLASSELRASDFEDPKHRLIMEAIVDRIESHQAVDPVTLSDYLETIGQLAPAGGLAYIGNIANNTPSSAAFLSYAIAIIRDSKARQRQKIGERLADQAPVNSEAGAVAIRDLMEIETLGASSHFCVISDPDEIAAAIDDLDERSSGDKLPGIHTGLDKLDSYFSGWQKTHLYVLAGRPGMGKTTLALNAAMAAQQDGWVGFFSAEQPRDEMRMRLCSTISHVSNEKIRAGHLDHDEWARITDAFAILRESKIIMDDSPAPNLDHLRRVGRKMKYDYDIKTLFVDYIQRLYGKGDSRQQEVEGIVRGLKELARELEIPVIALCQVNRAVEARTNKRPMIADLRDSGAIEQEADLVIALYRHELYDREDKGQKGIIEISILKHRHGRLGTIRAYFLGREYRVSEKQPDMWNEESITQ